MFLSQRILKHFTNTSNIWPSVKQHQEKKIKKKILLASLLSWFLQPAPVVWCPLPGCQERIRAVLLQEVFGAAAKDHQVPSSALPHLWALIIQAQTHGFWALRQNPTLWHQNWGMSQQQWADRPLRAAASHPANVALLCQCHLLGTAWWHHSDTSLSWAEL